MTPDHKNMIQDFLQSPPRPNTPESHEALLAEMDEIFQPYTQGADFQKYPLHLGELGRLDLTNAAVHECSHQILTLYHGVSSEPTVFPIFREYENSDDPYWGGQTRFQYLPKDSNIRKLITLAGEIGVMLFRWACEYSSEADPDGWGLYYSIEASYSDSPESADGWSRTDWEGSIGWTKKDLLTTRTILEENWSSILSEAKRQISLGLRDLLDTEEFGLDTALAEDVQTRTEALPELMTVF